MARAGRKSSGAALQGEDDPEFVRALARGLQVLEAFDARHARLSLSDVARRVSLPRGSARRLLMTLAHLGHVGFDGEMFFLRPRVLKLGFGYLSALPVWTVAGRVVEAVATETGESCSIAVLDGAEIVYVARTAARRIVYDYIAVGTRLPAYATSMGKVLLAWLAPEALDALLANTTLVRHTPTTITDQAALRRELTETRARGWAVNDEEVETDLRSIAVPVRGPDGVAAAINVSVQASRVTRDRLAEYLPVLQNAAAEIETLLRNRRAG